MLKLFNYISFLFIAVIQTIPGNIYADEGLKFISDERMVGQHIKSKDQTGKNNLVLSTINGNMYLRN